MNTDSQNGISKQDWALIINKIGMSTRWLSFELERRGVQYSHASIHKLQTGAQRDCPYAVGVRLLEILEKRRGDSAISEVQHETKDRLG